MSDINTASDSKIDKQAVYDFLLDLQNRICSRFESLDVGATFIEDAWQRPEGGGGKTRVISGGKLFEKGGANFSHVFGDKLPPSASANRPELAGRSFEAMGVSVVMHPDNPFIPTSHANVRFFIAEKPGEPAVWWFGGGFDLTPFYGFAEDCVSWHQQAKSACDPFGKDVYSQYKQWCDDYFYLKHRDEPRGVGGLFFDDLNQWGFDSCFAFIQQVGNTFIEAYSEIVERRQATAFTAQQKDFQRFRRGRYVEFNLVYDRGTLFGLQSGGRTESILMSMPPQVNWLYDFQPEKSSPEAELYEHYLKPRDWLDLSSAVSPQKDQH